MTFTQVVSQLGVFCSALILTSSFSVAQYPAPGSVMNTTATPPGLVMQPGTPMRAPIQSATPNSVNSQFTQGGNVPGMPGIPGTNGKPMPTLNPYQNMQAPAPVRDFNGPVLYGQHTPSSAPEKPFANYEPAPVLSPYMNLYRRDNFTGIDNYNLYVKPAIQAEQKRQQMQQQLNSVQQTQNQQAVQQQVQFNTNVGASTVGSSYGQMNTGMRANNPGASYGFSGTGPTVHVDPKSVNVQTDKEKMDKELEEDEKEQDEKEAAYFNPYNPTRRGFTRPHYEPARR